jgi:O-glycosyl hydrolase
MFNITSVLLLALIPTTVTTSADPSIEYQTWEGFGTSLAWWAHVVGAYAEPLRTNLVDKVLGGLKINVLRYNIGGGEAPNLSFMEPRACVPGFLSVKGKYDWTADAAQRWVLARGIKLGASSLEAFSNSPPYFMTNSGSVTGAKDGGDNLNPAHLNDFAAYLATVTKHFQEFWGIRFETLEPMNEPAANWWTYGNRQEGCHVSPGQDQSNLIVATAKALKTLKAATRVSASDENSNDQAVSSWDALTTEAKADTMRLNTHCYFGSSQHWVNHRAVRDTKRLWMSEYGDGDASGMTMAHQIVTDLRMMMPTAWVYWQVIDGGGGWGCIDMDLNHNATSYKINPKYYALAQFSQFIHPGAKFIAITDPNTVCVVQGSQVVIVSVSTDAQTTTYDLSKFTSVGKTASVFQTSATQNLAHLPPAPVTAKTVTVDLPQNSVTTLVIDECAYKGVVYSGFQTLSSEKTGQMLDVPEGSWSEGQALTTSKPSGAYSQQWRIEGDGAGWYKMCNRNSGMYAALWDSAANNFPILQWEDNGDTTLPWGYNVQSDGAYEINAFRYPGQCITENPNRGNGWPDVEIYDWYSGKEQCWSVKTIAPLYPSLSSKAFQNLP